MFDESKVIKLSEAHPKPADAKYTYGTAGFRMKADLLDSVIFRVGLLAVLRSKKLYSKIVGVMITASHNPEEDNGVKLVEPLGEMLEQSWEAYATQLANAASEQELNSALADIIKKEGIDFSLPAKVIVARDTRPSGPALVAALQDGVHALDGSITDYGLLSTPQLHYITCCLNTANTPDAYGEATESGYYDKLAAAFRKIVSGKPKLPALTVDAANGIGAPALRKLAEKLGEEYFTANIINDHIDVRGKLNNKCGADFVKLYQKQPEGMELQPHARTCSLDGDADRIVYYYADDAKRGMQNEDERFNLLDGDKIATLAAGFIMDLVRQAKAEVTHADGSKAPLTVGLVQTAYANGSSTAYVKDVLQVPVVFTPTGVKHLHHEAAKFDVGVYFEANGHGTVLFSKAAQKAFKDTKGKSGEELKALETLQALADVINQTVGDALSDMLLVEAILTSKQISPADWNKAYTDLPSRQEKVKVANRHIFIPIKADTELSAPAGLQEKINQQVAKFKNGRSFVRPSGTEDIVRVYAEADTRENTDRLANIICGIVFDGYGGVGERPAKYVKVDADGNVVN
ncbi:Phosphoacetylglucosamine Mutase [Quaeritorhiza haematococci]|nr:Phosphoacetylglucosamine Mutase [Quaeritorhiza haematococci]